jgi:hypothetical protein
MMYDVRGYREKLGHSMEVPKISFVHIRKAGGSAIKHMLCEDTRFELHKHEVILPKIWNEDPNRKVFFVVRDPVSRFVSGFNSRLRNGAPARTATWAPEEAEAFELFETPNDLAEALSSGDRWHRGAARIAMHTIPHVKTPLRYWLRRTSLLERQKEQILFIGFLPKLDDEMPILRECLALPESYSLPEDEALAHRAPSTDSTSLSQTGWTNIVNWYAADMPVFEWCLSFREKMGLRNV